MPLQENLTAAQEFVSDLQRGDIESLRRWVAADFYNNYPGEGDPPAGETYYQIATALKAAAPDLSIAVSNMAAVDDRGTALITLSGTRTGTLWGALPSGRQITWTVPVSFRFSGGKVAINWDSMTPPDMAGLLRQLDLMNPAGEMDKPTKYPVVVPELFMRVAWTGQAGDKPCSHLHEIRVTEPMTHVCEDCVALGDSWPALRMCLICGYVGCCDLAKNRHMKQHYEKTGHSIFRSINMEEGWIWCYADTAFRGKAYLEQHHTH